MRKLWMMGLAVHAVMVLAHPAGAQTEESKDVHLGNDCRLAVQVLTTGHPAPQRGWALSTISSCTDSGPPVLARMWHEVNADPEALDALMSQSGRIRDQRLYAAVRAIAEDRSISEIKRAAALELLGSWARPGFYLGFRQFFRPSFESAVQSGVQIIGVSDTQQKDGAEPLSTDVRVEVLRLAREIAVSSPGFRLRAAAEALASLLD